VNGPVYEAVGRRVGGFGFIEAVHTPVHSEVARSPQIHSLASHLLKTIGQRNALAGFLL